MISGFQRPGVFFITKCWIAAGFSVPSSGANHFSRSRLRPPHLCAFLLKDSELQNGPAPEQVRVKVAASTEPLRVFPVEVKNIKQSDPLPHDHSPIQWPAMLVTVIAAWMVASQRKFKRNWGFWLFLLSNVLWIVWGLHDRAFALIFLQLCLAFLNVRGAMKNRPQETKT